MTFLRFVIVVCFLLMFSGISEAKCGRFQRFKENHPRLFKWKHPSAATGGCSKCR